MEIKKPLITEERYRAELVANFGVEWAAISLLPYEDRLLAIGEVVNRHGESPRDRAWPTEGGTEPTPEEGWDPSGSFRPDVVRQVYEEMVRAGKIVV